MNLFLLIQNDVTGAVNEAASTAAAATQTVVKEMNIWDLTLKGGWIMIPIALLLFIAVAVLIERALVIKKAEKEEPSFMSRIKDYIHEGKIESALNLCRLTNTPYSRMIEKGISRIGRPMGDIQVAIENVADIEIQKIERGFTWVATAAAAAPMLGFLGTVTGMVRAFFDMANAGSNVDISLLSSGIYEALITTVAGLIVGIIALLSYNWLMAQVNGLINRMESKSMEFMDLLNEPTK
ncbi:MAG: MotA/TolQ/ExbB proton channel family protein [Dysgonamonadaceae bacterium]|jgi:biopolymer transport protein ExbB|nr:MotA/TolQ/ExbB proton channel family protein [Dysgonamonadaceae bacterium]